MASLTAGFYAVTKRRADGSLKEYQYPNRRVRAEPKHLKGSIGAVIAAYRISQDYLNLRPTTRAGYDRVLNVIWMAVAAQQVKTITRAQVLHMRDAIAAAKEKRVEGSRQGGPSAANTFVSVTSKLMSFAIDREVISANPVTRIKAIEIGEYEAWTPEQAEEAIAKLPHLLRRAVILGLYTGQRRSDLIKMRWDDIKGVTLRVVPTKTGRKKKSMSELRIPLHPELAEELRVWRGMAKGDFILETERGRPWIPTYLSRELATALQAMGLPAGLNVHGLRKLAATNLAQAGCSTHEIAAITGHRTLGMVQHYTASANQEKLATAAVLRLPASHRKTA